MKCGCKKKQKELNDFLVQIEKEIKNSIGDEDERNVQLVQTKFLLGVHKILKNWRLCGCFFGKTLSPIFMMVGLGFRSYKDNYIMLHDLHKQYKFASHSISELNV